jgi:hypothetical protein
MSDEARDLHRIIRASVRDMLDVYRLQAQAGPVSDQALEGIIFRAALTGYVASQKGRDVASWVIISFILPLLGLIALAALPAVGRSQQAALVTQPEDVGEMTKKCPECAETIKLEARVCKHCHYRFDPVDVAQQVENRARRDSKPTAPDQRSVVRKLVEFMNSPSNFKD